MPSFELHLDFLQLVVKANPRQRNALIRTSSIVQRLAIIEIIYNYLHGSFTLSDELKLKLSSHKAVFRKLSKKKAKNRVALFIRNITIIQKFLAASLKQLIQ